jgi:hypothetical protein
MQNYFAVDSRSARRGRIGQNEFSKNQKEKTREPNRKVDHRRRLRFELQLRSAREAATQNFGSSPGSWPPSSTSSPAALSFTFLSLSLSLIFASASLRSAAASVASLPPPPPPAVAHAGPSGRLCRTIGPACACCCSPRSDPPDRHPVSGHGRTKKNKQQSNNVVVEMVPRRGGRPCRD